MNVLNELKAARFIAILRRVPQSKIVEVAGALARAGIRFAEITFDPSDPDTLRDTARKLALVREAFPEMHSGCGTVLTEAMAETAARAGAEYCLAPNTRKSVIDCCRRHQILVFPGAYTPCEIADAWEMGADAVKIFPVQSGEEKYVTNVMTPLSHIPFLVTGGVNPETIRAMLATGALAVAAGASVVPADAVEACDYDRITELARRHLERI